MADRHRLKHRSTHPPTHTHTHRHRHRGGLPVQSLDKSILLTRETRKTRRGPGATRQLHQSRGRVSTTHLGHFSRAFPILWPFFGTKKLHSVGHRGVRRVGQRAPSIRINNRSNINHDRRWIPGGNETQQTLTFPWPISVHCDYRTASSSKACPARNHASSRSRRLANPRWNIAEASAA